MRFSFIIGIILMSISSAGADVRFAGIFGDGMVLQRDKPLTIWGFADAGEEVTVKLGEQSKKATPRDGGRWGVTFDALPAARGLTLSAAGKNTVSLKDISVGEVWLCSGQSNMQFAVDASAGGAAAVAAANDPDIRIVKINNATPFDPAPDVATTGWSPVTPQSVAKFSAVGYYFAVAIKTGTGDLKDVPIGLINASQGWTPAEAWMSRESLTADPEMKRDILDKWDMLRAVYPKSLADAKKRVDAGEQNVPQPFDPSFMHRPAAMWNGDIAPLAGLSMRGIIWYQGETNDSRAEQYRRLFPLMVKDWRRHFGQDDLPFLFVELAPVLRPLPDAGDSEWAELRESQRFALKLKNVAMAQTGDIGWTFDVHPLNKHTVGQRLAQAALATVYGVSNLPYSGPIYRSHEIIGKEIKIDFDHAHGDLYFKGGSPEGFQIAGADKKWKWARARIEGANVFISHNDIPEPVAARYAWSNYPLANFFNGADLPASCFRTDDWPELTKGSTIMFPDQSGIDYQTGLPRKISE